MSGRLSDGERVALAVSLFSRPPIQIRRDGDGFHAVRRGIREWNGRLEEGGVTASGNS